MKRTVHLGRAERARSEHPLFPDPTTIFHEWTEELARRILPVARFDLALTGEPRHVGPAVFLYHEDLTGNADFLTWEVEDGKIVGLGQDLSSIRPFSEPPDTAAVIERLGGFLHFSRYDLTIGAPSQVDDWDGAFEERMEAAGANPFRSLRIGGGYPCFVQSTWPVDDGPGFVAELPAGRYDLEPLQLYLFEFSGSFQQITQIT